MCISQYNALILNCGPGELLVIGAFFNLTLVQTSLNPAETNCFTPNAYVCVMCVRVYVFCVCVCICVYVYVYVCVFVCV